MYLSPETIHILGKSLENDYIFIRKLVLNVFEMVTGFINRNFYTQRVIEFEDDSDIKTTNTICDYDETTNTIWVYESIKSNID